QILNLGDQPLVINQGGQRPEITNLSFTILGWDLDGVIPPLDLPLPPTGPAPEITIQPGDLVFMLVRFTGLDIGSQVGAIRIFTNECVIDPNNPPCVLKNVRGNVVRPPQCVLSPTSVTLNAFAACTSAQETVTITNTGGLNLVINEIIGTTPEIVVLDPATNAPPVLPVSVLPGATVQFVVRCTPLSVGTRTATIRFVTNDANPLACVLSVTCVATRGPICEVVMPDTSPQPTGGAPDGKTFGEVVIAPMDNPLFGMVITDPTGMNPPVVVGRKVLPIVVRNTGDAPLILGRDRNGNPTPNVVTLTNINYRVEGFNSGDTIPPGGSQTGQVIFQPTLRQVQVTTIRIFTNTCVGECVITDVNGIGTTNALCQIPTSLNVGSAPVGGSVTNTFLLVNRGDRELRVDNASQIVIDNPAFTVVTPLPIVVLPEFAGGAAGVPITVRFTPTAPGQQIGRITLNFSPTQLTQVFPGTPAPCTINVSGNGTMASANVTSETVADAAVSVPVTGASRRVVGKQE
ncbi:MAG: choice-of-anchor D domain-containing protein, partial [Acidobacteria bacterium]|nr:choice-of-anchor D domain-containing protein [Acidobacteriota bacterium]